MFNGDVLREYAITMCRWEGARGVRRRNQNDQLIPLVSCAVSILPNSPLELDSVRLGVPSVQVGVEPSTDAGGVQVRTPRELY